MKLDSVPAPRFPDSTIPTVSKRVLLLDDDADILSFYALTLARAGYAVETAADGQQGWEALCAAGFDLLLTDNDMPRLTGVELVARLRRAGMTLPVIIASGSIALPWGGDGGWAGLTTMLRKPFSPDELLAAVQRRVPLRGSAPAFIHPRVAPDSEFMSSTQPRFAGLNE